VTALPVARPVAGHATPVLPTWAETSGSQAVFQVRVAMRKSPLVAK
jgi:hypothetical protein